MKYVYFISNYTWNLAAKKKKIEFLIFIAYAIISILLQTIIFSSTYKVIQLRKICVSLSFSYSIESESS